MLLNPIYPYHMYKYDMTEIVSTNCTLHLKNERRRHKITRKLNGRKAKKEWDSFITDQILNRFDFHLNLIIYRKKIQLLCEGHGEESDEKIDEAQQQLFATTLNI